MILHASGDFSKRIIVGFYLYYIVHQDKESREYVPPLGDLEAFENEWMEVEIRDPEAMIEPHEIGIANFLHNDFFLQPIDYELYKQSHLEIDANTKSDRTEWGHARYHQIMKPGYAFEIVVQWITASGPIVYDLVYNWSRKATQCGFQLVPVSKMRLGHRNCT
jgi:DEP domain-containing protein 5